MDSNEGSDSELPFDLMGTHYPSYSVQTDSEGMPGAVNILRPQIDLIFSEVQKNLPTIDFDSSDISSDNDVDEPIFFHHQLKTGELGGGFDEDKDLDSSFSGGDFSSRFEPKTEGVVYNNDPNQGTEANDLDSAIVDGTDDLDLVNDNDLANMLEQSSFPSDNEIRQWKKMATTLEQFQRHSESQDDDDLQRSRLLGHLTSLREGLMGSHDQRSHDHGTSTPNETLALGVSTSTDMEGLDPSQITIETREDRQQTDTQTMFNNRLHGHTIHNDMDPREKRRIISEQNRSKDSEIASMFAPREKLSLRFFEDVDLESVMNAASEENIPISSLRLVGHPDDSQLPKAHAGGGDTAKADVSEELTLIQKLANLSMSHIGTKVKAVDPRTGAAIITTKPLLINNQSNDGVISTQTETKTKGVSRTMGTGTSSGVSSSGTNTANAKDAGKILWGRNHNEVKNKEPGTVFIDLRGFEKQKKEEEKGIESVQRVLGIQPGEEDSSSESEEEMVERCNWRETRQKIKQDLTSQGASATLPLTSRTAGGHHRRGTYKRPTRVINLQEHPVGSKWNKTTVEVLPDPFETEEEMERRRKEEADNKLKQEAMEVEREKERVREEARKQREKREKERDQRLRMSQKVEAARSQASTQGRQSAGENTPAVFDLESSYEPAPTSLPTTLPVMRETLLLSVNLSSSGEIVQHKARSNRSVDTGEGLSATYTALLSWLLSLVPGSFSFLTEDTKNSPYGKADDKPASNAPGFNVLGLQQVWSEEQLKLMVVVTPSGDFARMKSARSSKAKKDEVKGLSKFAQHMTKLLTTNTVYSVCPWLANLVSVEVRGERSEDKAAPPYTYSPPLPKISTKPLSTFVQVNPDPQAARKMFNIPVGFLWQTVDNEEGLMDLDLHDDEVSYETQNTMSLVYKKIFQEPVSLMAILNRVSQEGLDLSGVRLLYPSQALLKQQNPNLPECSDLEMLNNVGPVLALALRGTFARTIWLDAIGPSDPELARRTDPNSLCAQFGGETREKALLFCPRNPSRVQTELSRWFGGRIPNGACSIDLGIPYIRREERSKKGKKATDPVDPRVTSPRPPAALAATSKGDIILLLSPLLPLSYVGVVMATAQRRGYQIRGVKRVLVTGKTACTLGLPPSLQSYFCPGARLDDMDESRPIEARAPSTVLVLRKENATHNTPSLIEAFMVQLTLAGLLGCVQMRCSEQLTSKHLFHASTYSDVLMAMLGGHLHKSPEFNLSHLRLSSSMSGSVGKDLEQMAVVIVLGHDLLKKCGMVVGKLLSVLPYSKANPPPSGSDRCELLGVKWLPSLTSYQAKELTPFEVGDRRWRNSVKQLTQEPALVLAMRGVDIFRQLKPVIDYQQAAEREGGGHKRTSLVTSTALKEQKLTCMMSGNPGQSDAFARLFFHTSELFPDPLARSILPYLPESRLYFNIMESNVDGEHRCLFTLKPLDDLDLTQESVMADLEGGQQPITTLLLVKPSAVKKYMARVLRKLVQEDFNIVGLRLLMLTEEQAPLVIPSLKTKDSGQKPQHMKALISSPSLALVLSQRNAVKKLLDLVGPEEPMAARRQSQFLWRGEFGTDLVNNGLYCSGTYVDAVRDVKLMFPDGLCCQGSELLTMEEICAPGEDSFIEGGVPREVKVIRQTHVTSNPSQATLEDAHSLLLQSSCLILPPPLVRQGRSKELPGLEVLGNLLYNGFELSAARLVWLTQRQAQDLLAILGGGSFRQVQFLCEGPCLILAVQRDNAVVAFNTIVNMTSDSIRLMKEYGDLILRPNTVEQAHHLLAFFFDQLMPGSQALIVDKPRSP